VAETLRQGRARRTRLRRQVLQYDAQYDAALRPDSKGGGYVNFMSDDDQGRVSANDAQNCARLVAIKRRYDPKNLFRLNQNIAP
jgi:FAD/FMN-containing dehydrogenase